MRTNRVLGVLGAALLVAGCGPPQVAPANRRLIDGLRTATSSEQMQWVDQCAEQLEEGKTKGTVTDEEYQEFQAIIRLAKKGNWKEANAQAVRFAKAQQPTTEEVERATARQKTSD